MPFPQVIPGNWIIRGRVLLKLCAFFSRILMAHVRHHGPFFSATAFLAWFAVQVHYLKERPAGDRSGVSLQVADTSQPRSLSVILFAPWFDIPGGKQEHNVTDSCCIQGFEALVPWAARVHAHSLGRKISLAHSTDPVTQSSDWLAAAVCIPSKPQPHYIRGPQ
jgi:hypothetical protein